MAYKKPKNLFECFERWHPLFNGVQTTLATIDDQFEPEKHRNAALAALIEIAEEVGHDLTDAYKTEFMQSAEEKDVKNFADIEHTRYGRRLDGIIEHKFDELWEATPDNAKSDLYTLITSFKPRADLTGLSDTFDKALKEHKFLSKILGKLDEYQNTKIQSKRNEIEREFVDMYNEEIDKAYLDTPEKERENRELAKAMKTWAKKSPQQMLLRRIDEKRKKAQEKFKELIRLKDEEGKDDEEDKPANFREYMRTVLDTDGQRSLYGTAILHYKYSEREDKLKKASDYQMAG